MTKKVNVLLPSATFFTNGSVRDGFCNLVLQCTIIFWPFALAWARRFRAKVMVEEALTEIARVYKISASSRQMNSTVSRIADRGTYAGRTRRQPDGSVSAAFK
jgi:hypothetical protein